MSNANANHEDVIGSNSWLLEKTNGANLFDKFVLNSLKIIYIGLRVFLRLALGKKRRDRFYAEREINFKDFLYSSIELLGLDGSLLLIFDAPRHDYKFYSRITRKVENFLINDMYASMSSHEDEIIEHFSPKEGDVVVDVGAAFGFYTILSSLRVGRRGKVVAIEAHPDSFEMLNRNINLNELDNVMTLNYAAYSHEAKLRLYSGFSLMKERAPRNSNNEKFVEVNANTLDLLLSRLVQLKQVHWIKIDVEGTELEVLNGAHKILSESKDLRLLIEIHSESIYESVKTLLDSYDFKIEFEKGYQTGNKHIVLRKMA